MRAKEGLVSGLVGDDRQTDLTLGLVGLADEGKVDSHQVDEVRLCLMWVGVFTLVSMIVRTLERTGTRRTVQIKPTAVRQVYNIMRSARHISGFDDLGS